MENKILLSTDIGSDVDDALSLLTILNTGMNLKGIYTVNGNVKARAFIAKHMVNLSGKKDIIIGCGESEPLGSPVSPYYHLEECLVDDSFIDYKKMEKSLDRDLYYKPLNKFGIVNEGKNSMGDVLSKGRHVIFSIGPMTNIAKLLREKPHVTKNIERIYIMGCKFPGEILEHNVRYDSAAAKEVLESDLPLTIIPGDVCSKYEMPFDFNERMNQSKTGKYVRKMLRAYVGSKLVRKVHEEYKEKSTKKLESTKLEDSVMRKIRFSPNNINKEEFLRFSNFAGVFLANFDIYSVYYETNEFWNDFNKFIVGLRNNVEGRTVAREFESCVPRNVSVADVYVPYCYLNPNKMGIEKMNLTCDFQGHTEILPGKKHDVVRELDYNHFESYLKEYLR